MSALDFKEIPAANENSGQQDAFELFAEEYLRRVGYKIIRGPGRGADRGKDLVVEGPLSEENVEQIRWLVSCKHYAHSGESVRPAVEFNIRDRVESNDCQGFIGFYSTITSQGLEDILAGLASKMPYKIIHHKHIEEELLKEGENWSAARRWFPKSYATWIETTNLSLRKVRDEFDKFRTPEDSPYQLDVLAQGNGWFILPRLKPGVEDAPPLKLAWEFRKDNGELGEEFFRLLGEGRAVRIPADQHEVTYVSKEIEPYFGSSGDVIVVPLTKYAEAIIIAENGHGDIVEIDGFQLLVQDQDHGLIFRSDSPLMPLDVEVEFSFNNDAPPLSFQISKKYRGRSVRQVKRGIDFFNLLINGGRIDLRIALNDKVHVEGRNHVYQLVPGKGFYHTQVVEPGSIVPDEQMQRLVRNLRVIEDKLRLCFIFPDRELMDDDHIVAENLAEVVVNGVLVREGRVSRSVSITAEVANELVQNVQKDAVCKLNTRYDEVDAELFGIPIGLGPALVRSEAVCIPVEELGKLKVAMETMPGALSYDVTWISLPGIPIIEEYMNWSHSNQ